MISSHQFHAFGHHKYLLSRQSRFAALRAATHASRLRYAISLPDVYLPRRYATDFASAANIFEFSIA